MKTPIASLPALIPFFASYPLWVRLLVAGWLAFGVAILILLIFIRPHTDANEAGTEELQEGVQRERSAIATFKVSIESATPPEMIEPVSWSSTSGKSRSYEVSREYSLQPHSGGITLYPAGLRADSVLGGEKVLTFDDTSPQYIRFEIDLETRTKTLVIQETCRASGAGPGVVARQLWYRIIRGTTGVTAWCSDDEAITLTLIRIPDHDGYFTAETTVPLSEFSINGKPPVAGDELQVLFACNPKAVPQSEPDLVGDWLLRRLEISQYE